MMAMGLLRYFHKPRYVIMKGICVEDRCLLYLGVNAEYSKDDYNNTLVSFSNRKQIYGGERYFYYSNRLYKRIWTFKQLIRWRRLLGKSGEAVLRKTKLNGWEKLTND